jgi:hypothetical protein
MDPGVVGVFIPIVAIMVGGLAIFVKSDLGRALARRIGGDPRVAAALEDEVHLLRGEVDALRGEIAETHERLDFTERLLSRAEEPPRPAESPASDNRR